MESEDYRRFLMRIQCGRENISPDAIYRARFKMGLATKDELKEAAFDYFEKAGLILVYQSDDNRGIVVKYPAPMPIEYRRVLTGAMVELLGVKVVTDTDIFTTYALPDGLTMAQAMPVADMVHNEYQSES